MVGILDASSRGGGDVLHPTSSRIELSSRGFSNVKVAYEPPFSITGERRHLTAMSSTTAAVPKMSIIGVTSLSGIRSHQDQTSCHTCTRGLSHDVRRIPDETVVVPCSAKPEFVSEDIVT